MSDRFDIPAGEHGVVRIFEVTLDDPAKQRALLTGDLEQLVDVSAGDTERSMACASGRAS